ncbi:rho GDP-dissociation inhibitor 1-like [Genypterus blacodes]|uniref:rho GDP-dissociation inhibitor 1-like n=1 Tax=Genypterus blacodes TaxID=154954 RepID=UPI003F763EFB
MLGFDVCEFGGQVLELLWLTMCYRGLLADKEFYLEEEEDERKLNYVPPSQKSLQEIQDLDQEDESLIKYKQQLLGHLREQQNVDSPNVMVTRLSLMCAEAPEPLSLDLTDLKAVKDKVFTLKAGTEYRLKVHFQVNKEIVSGLKYVQVNHRKGVRVDKVAFMVGSYGPRLEEQEFVSRPFHAPVGLTSVGCYNICSKFTDDDKNPILAWDWSLNVAREWNQ